MQDAALLIPPPAALLEPFHLGTPEEFMIPRNYIDGFQLSNDVSNPNTALDIGAGMCADSTNKYLFQGNALVKNTTSTWSAGNNQPGMGNGLTIAPNTWYHVHEILINNAIDTYFDTSPTAANAPNGTIANRRVGSFKTNGSSQIITFIQAGEWFYFAPVTEYNSTSSRTMSALTLAGVPTGVVVFPKFSGIAAPANGVQILLELAPVSHLTWIWTSVSILSSGTTQVAANLLDGPATNTSAQVGFAVTNNGALNSSLQTVAYQDRRGKDGP